MTECESDGESGREGLPSLYPEAAQAWLLLSRTGLTPTEGGNCDLANNKLVLMAIATALKAQWTDDVIRMRDADKCMHKYMD